jgi:hypothetical protein
VNTSFRIIPREYRSAFCLSTTFSFLNISGAVQSNSKNTNGVNQWLMSSQLIKYVAKAPLVLMKIILLSLNIYQRYILYLFTRDIFCICLPEIYFVFVYQRYILYLFTRDIFCICLLHRFSTFVCSNTMVEMNLFFIVGHSIIFSIVTTLVQRLISLSEIKVIHGNLHASNE